MAALIKKRVLAEFNQSQAIVNEPPIKRLKTLRLLSTSGSKNGTDSSSALAYIECLEKCKSGNDALQLLVRISDAIAYIAPEDVPIAIKKLAERFVVENEIAVRAKIFWVFAELGEVTPDTLEKAKIVNETAELLRNEESHRVKSQGLATLLKLGDYQRALVLKIAQEHLPDTWHGVQTRCLSIIGRYLTANAADDTLTLIGNYARSQDPRVRAQAFETMAELHSHRGCRLPASFFKEACAALGDDYEIVRRAVLKLIYLLGREYPENIVVGSDGEDVRMVDCAFSQICSLMGDLSPRVRASAMSLLGTMKSVSRRYIEQALDKKQKVVEADRPEVEEKSGSCGAFIHGLEDEFLEVRTAAVEALCTLSLEQPSIARISLDFMVDMFNDEIQDVRLRAIESLKKMSSSVTLQEDQLETILGALEDFSGEVREGLHAMLAASHLATTNCLYMCVNRLLDNLSRYPQDRESIRSCLAELGASHPYLTLPLVPQLLGRHPFFDTPEPDVDEPSYASVLVLIFNAALHCPSMHALFTEHASKHYHYLRDTMPHLVPRLRPALTSSGIKMEDMDNEENRDKRGREFLEKMGIGIENARPGGRVHTQLLETAAIDLDRMAEMDHHMEGAARFTALYIRCLLLLKSVLKECSVSSTTSISANPVPNANNNIFVLLQHTQKLQRLFSGLDENDIILANDMWLKALAIELVRVTKSATGSALPLARYFLSEADALPQDTSKLPPFSRALVLQIPTLADVKPGSLTRLLLPLLLTPVVQGEERLPRPSATTRFCRAHIEEPRGDADAALKFTGGLLLGIPLNAKILNLRDPSTLRIKLRHPDQQVQLLLPRQSDLRMQQSNQKDYRLRTTVLLSHQVWMEPCNVEISLALLLPSSSICTHPPLDDPCVIDLCKPIKVSIAPKAIKRGI
ncbi:Integrator complex subunit 4 [Atta colombica]|uniref:Integrator complex subunit 4 n=1 Tax=Atta colombica TaxID=520822 RepID=A0A195AT02_9HYME|nr:PREDICTED: integrator complex subunit 4 [Atta colombica]XP_018058406.1 PREDICTED: integrator complex subunit 4 [Atta colombica]KYM75326.1 Integrator complex subunit 4 [Atta colombica]